MKTNPSLVESTARLAGQVEEHQTSGDSIPVGFEASHLNLKQIQDSDIDGSSMVSSVNSQQQQQQKQKQFILQPRQMFPMLRQENFCPVPESTFIPVEPAKDPPVSVFLL